MTYRVGINLRMGMAIFGGTAWCPAAWVEDMADHVVNTQVCYMNYHAGIFDDSKSTFGRDGALSPLGLGMADPIKR